MISRAKQNKERVKTKAKEMKRDNNNSKRKEQGHIRMRTKAIAWGRIGSKDRERVRTRVS